MKNLARGYLRGLQLKCCTEHHNVSEGKSQLASRPARRRYESGCNQARQNAPGDAQQRLELAYQDRVEQYGRTAGVSVIVLMGLYVLMRLTTEERAPGAPLMQQVAVTSLLVVPPLLHLVAVYWSPLRDLLGMVSIDADSWITILLASGLGITALHF